MAFNRSPEADQAESHTHTNSSQHSTDRTNTPEFNPLTIKRMEYKFHMPSVINLLRKKADLPWHMGFAVGMMMYHISPLVSTHLDNNFDFKNKIPSTLSWTPDFVPAIDQYIACLRMSDGCVGRFPNDLDVDRKGRRPRRKYMKSYTFKAGVAYKSYICEALANIFQSWNVEQTRLFNKGVDKALSGVQWVVYPDKNVVVGAGEDDWAVWLRGECEKLGMIEARAGRHALEAM
jgi:hypothetical protein